MSRRAPITPSSDVEREMPVAVGARVDALDAALLTLVAEERRLKRLGLDLAVRRCREQRRYWEFLRAVLTLPRDPRDAKRQAA